MDAASHFSLDGDKAPSKPGRFLEASEVPQIELVPGLEFRPILGEQVMANLVSFEPRVEAPTHAHEEEQLVVVLSGSLEFTIDGETRLLGPGDAVVVPPWVPHGARALDEPCQEIDVFSPPRATLVELLDNPSD